YKIKQDRYQLEPAIIYGAGPDTDISLGVTGAYYKTDPRVNPVLDGQPFYGQGDFTKFGLSARLRLDRTGKLALPRRGVFASAGAAFYPKVADVTEAYGAFHSPARVFLATPRARSLTLALRAP